MRVRLVIFLLVGILAVGAAQYVMAVDEFVEVEIPGLQPLTREEFRKTCNAHKTKPEILQTLSGPSP
jgi:hypothetical protein